MFYIYLINDDVEKAKEILSLDNLVHSHRVYIPIKSPQNDDDWVGCILDVSRNVILYYDPKYDDTNELLLPSAQKKMEDTAEYMYNYLSLIDIPAFQEKWALKMIGGAPYAPHDINQNDFDSAIYLYTVFSMAVNDMPIIFNQNNIHNIRSNLCYNVLKGSI